MHTYIFFPKYTVICMYVFRAVWHWTANWCALPRGDHSPSFPSFPLLPTVLCVELSLHGFCKVLNNMIIVLYLANLKFKQSLWWDIVVVASDVMSRHNLVANTLFLFFVFSLLASFFPPEHSLSLAVMVVQVKLLCNFI